jgi:hypothetical protein
MRLAAATNLPANYLLFVPYEKVTLLLWDLEQRGSCIKCYIAILVLISHTLLSPVAFHFTTPLVPVARILLEPVKVFEQRRFKS